MYAHIRYYYKIPYPENLPEERLLMLWADLQYIRSEEAKHTTTNPV